jgi:hypothetical protein
LKRRRDDERSLLGATLFGHALIENGTFEPELAATLKRLLRVGGVSAGGAHPGLSTEHRGAVLVVFFLLYLPN